jgi:hypothetical protein
MCGQKFPPIRKKKSASKDSHAATHSETFQVRCPMFTAFENFILITIPFSSATPVHATEKKILPFDSA